MLNNRHTQLYKKGLCNSIWYLVKRWNERKNQENWENYKMVIEYFVKKYFYHCTNVQISNDFGIVFDYRGYHYQLTFDAVSAHSKIDKL